MALHEHIPGQRRKKRESGERPSISHGRWDKDVAHEDVVGRLNMTTASPQQWRSVPALTEIRANLHVMYQRMHFSKMLYTLFTNVT